MWRTAASATQLRTARPIGLRVVVWSAAGPADTHQPGHRSRRRRQDAPDRCPCCPGRGGNRRRHQLRGLAAAHAGRGRTTSRTRRFVVRHGSASMLRGFLDTEREGERSTPTPQEELEHPTVIILARPSQVSQDFHQPRTAVGTSARAARRRLRPRWRDGEHR
jgi:hypothetical protein